MTLPDSLSATTVAVLGGTGPQGRGLARRFAAAGLPVVIGSRSAERATETARTLAEATGGNVTGADNAGASAAGDVVIVAVPWDGHGDLLKGLATALADKIVVDCVNPLGFDKRGAFVLDVEEGSAAEQAAALLPDSIVIGAFHNVSAVGLWGDEDYLDEDVLCVGDSDEGKQVAIELARSVTGREGISAGKLRLARQLEPLTAVLISINRKYKVHSGIRITGLEHASD